MQVASRDQPRLAVWAFRPVIKEETIMAVTKSAVDVTVTMEWSKSTKGTEVYRSDEDGAAITTLYVGKSAFKGEAPQTITVTIK